jgi:hypothetical protein
MCAAGRTYGLDSTHMASMKVVLAGKAFIFSLMYFFIALVLVKGKINFSSFSVTFHFL